MQIQTTPLLTDEQMAAVLEAVHQFDDTITEADVESQITDLLPPWHYQLMAPDLLAETLLRAMASIPWLKQHRPDVFLPDWELFPGDWPDNIT